MSDLRRAHGVRLVNGPEHYQEAEEALPSKPGSDKKEWVKMRAREAVKHIDLKKLPAFLEDPIKDAVVSVIIDVVWALVFKKKES
jgi:hypothetical protein